MQYSASQILTDTGLSVIKRRPLQFLPSLDEIGLWHMAGEILDNAFDEATHLKEKGQVDVRIFKGRDNIDILIRDNGRGIPPEKLLESFTVPHTSGKYDQASYTYSSGLFGLGSKVAAGLSERLRVVTMRPDKEASLFVERGDHPDKLPLLKGKGNQGVLVLFRPDPEVFSDIKSHMETSWTLLLERIRKYSYFRDEARIRLFLSETGLDPSVYTGTVSQIRKATEGSDQALVFSSESFDRESWIQSYLGIRSGIPWRHEMIRDPDKDSSMAYRIRLFLSEEMGSTRLGIVNGVGIDRPRSHHLFGVTDTLKDILAPNFSGAVKAFFLDTYTLPVHVVADVLFEGAEFTGTTKYEFRSQTFLEDYKRFLKSALRTSQGQEAIRSLLGHVGPDVEEKYLISVKGRTTIKMKGRLYQDLNYPNKFSDCTTKDRSKAELFIVEGDSAGGGIRSMRDGETQGLYTLRGVPDNSIYDEDLDQARILLQGNKIYQDLIRILDLNVRDPNMDALYFSKILILCDADSYGHHIAALLLGNLYALCPSLFRDGRVEMVRPPYYGLTFLKKGTSGKKVYILDEPSLTRWMTDHVYREALDLEVTAEHPDPKDPSKTVTSRFPLQGEEYADFIRLVLPIGETFDILAAEFAVPPEILEMLTFITQYLDPRTMDINRIRDLLKVDQAFYMPNDHVLTIAIGRNDHVIPLTRLRDRIYNSGLIRMLNAISWRRLQLYVTYRNIDQEKRFVTTVQLHAILKSLQSGMRIQGFKGIGSVSPEDIRDTCLRKESRTTVKVKGPDDISIIPKLLGRDSTWRKELMADYTEGSFEKIPY